MQFSKKKLPQSNLKRGQQELRHNLSVFAMSSTSYQQMENNTTPTTVNFSSNFSHCALNPLICILTPLQVEPFLKWHSEKPLWDCWYRFYRLKVLCITQRQGRLTTNNTRLNRVASDKSKENEIDLDISDIHDITDIRHGNKLWSAGTHKDFCLILTALKNKQNISVYVGLAIVRSLVQLPIRMLSNGHYLDKWLPVDRQNISAHNQHQNQLSLPISSLWQATLYDAIWQVMLHSSEMAFPWKAIPF